MRRGDRRRAFLFFWPSRPYNRDEPDVRRSEKPELLSYVAVSHVPPLALRTARMEEASCVSVCDRLANRFRRRRLPLVALLGILFI